MISRRTFLKGSALFGGAMMLDGFLIEPKSLTVERVEVGIKGLPPSFEGFTICQITDVHHSDIVTLEYLDKLVALANGLKPDLVALTGDYVDDTKSFVGPALKKLSGLKGRFGLVSILGNHDHFVGKDFSVGVIQSHDIPLLENSHMFIEKGGAAICVGGTKDYMEDLPDAKEALKGVDKDMPRVLLCHHPDYAEYMPKDVRIDLVLSGHTHGGQVRLPFYAPVVPSDFGQKYAGGLVRLERDEGTQVYVSRGVGLVMIPVRINCPPEITLITLRKEDPVAA